MSSDSGPVFHKVHPNSRKARQQARCDRRVVARRAQATKTNKVHKPLIMMFKWYKDYLIAHGNEPLSAEGLSSVTEEYLEEKSYAATAFKMETNRALHATASKQGVIFTLKTSLEEERKQFSLYGLDVPDLVDPKCVEELQNWKGDHEPIAKGILTTRKVRPLHPETFKVEII